MPDNKSLEPLVEAAMVEALETMCFSGVLAPLPQNVRTEDSLTTEVHFTGDAKGHLRVVLSRDAAQTVASNFLGEDPDQVGPQQVEEVACELTNMICGCMLTTYDNNGRFDLSAPVVRSEGTPESDVYQGWQLEVGTIQTLLAVS